LNGLSELFSTLRDRFAELRAALLCRRLRRSAAQAGVALVYHRVGGDHSGDASREILPALSGPAFAKHVRHLKHHYRLVPASGLVDAVRNRRRGERFPACVTFDDDLAGHVRETLPILRQEGVTATFFVGGVSLDGPHAFWWQDLQTVIDNRLLDALPHIADADLRPALEREPKAIFRVAAAIESLEPQERAETAAALRAAAGGTVDEGLEGDDMARLLAAGCDIGFHTLRHEALPQLDDDALEAALRDGRDRLETVTGRRLALVSYPHGKADERVAGAARTAGYDAGFTTGRSAVNAETDPLLVPRIPPALAPGKTALRIARAVASCTSR
jgi:peptidoglycan/xylan/chitin deacetylase (PgdA/CDA1 family)